jgi:dTDP-L-rhamnose 4-epimerase
MSKLVLITGGAGFIGSHVADELLAHGYRVRALDVLSPQVHGDARERPSYLDSRVELKVGDVTDPIAVREALEGVDAVFHFAAAVGVGQSMYEAVDYTRTNTLGTAVLLSALERRPLSRLVVASSMSIYGEGRYLDQDGHPHDEVDRALEDLSAGRWEPGEGELTPIPTPESKPPRLSSVYALNKLDQELMSLILGRAYRIPTVALRFFNVYGPRQALSNPYTGVLAIFAARLLNGRPPLIFEDGRQKRDFVSVHDVARCCRLALESDRAPGEVYTVGSGRPATVAEIAERMARVLGREDLTAEITGRYRMGDIRHCFADIEKARAELEYQPSVSLEDGIRELAGWLRGRVAEDHAEEAQQELSRRGLTL